MCNLLQNPSFEAGLSGWVTDNVGQNSVLAFEGTQAAVLNHGLASIFQDVLLPETVSGPLLLSFSVLSLYPPLVNPEGGNLVAEVIWQDVAGSPVGTGLRLFIPGTMLAHNENRLTYIEVTDRPPANAAKVRLQFSKGELNSPEESLIIDQVILAPLEDINLVTNSGFQERLFDWNNANSGASGFQPYEGTINAVLNSGGVGTIFQDIPINSQPANSSFLLSFAVNSDNSTPLLVTVDYRNGGGSLGIGLNLTIPPFAPSQRGWKTYAVATETAAPAGATIARVSFTGVDPGVAISVDKVILTRVGTPNLINNPSFETGLTNWTSENVIATGTGDNYEGTQHASASGPAFIFQDVNIQPSSSCCYLLTFGAQGVVSSDILAEVLWLNAAGREIGLGTSLVIPRLALSGENATGQLIPIFSTFAAVTELSPLEATAARILFTVPNFSAPDIDMVSFTRILCPPAPPPTRGIKF